MKWYWVHHLSIAHWMERLCKVALGLPCVALLVKGQGARGILMTFGNQNLCAFFSTCTHAILNSVTMEKMAS